MASKWFDLGDYISVHNEVFENLNGTVEELPRMLTNTQFAIGQFASGVLLCFTGLLGIITNAISVFVFLKMSPKDGVVVSFLGLSTSDLLASLCSLVYSQSLILFAEELNGGPRFHFDPFVPRVFLANLAYMSYTITALLTLFIAVTRCMCVARPLQFGNLFNASLSGWFIIGCYIFGFANYLPLLGNMGVMESFMPAMNRTRLGLWFSPFRETIKDVVFTVTLTFVTFITMLVLFLCVIIMTVVLRKASMFRSRATSNQQVKSKKDGESVNEIDADESPFPDAKLSRKELRVVHQVLLLSMLYLVCTTPQMIVSIASTIVPGLDANPQRHRYARLYYQVNTLRHVLVQVNSAVNLFIYLKYNQAFREIFQRKICSFRSTDQS